MGSQKPSHKKQCSVTFCSGQCCQMTSAALAVNSQWCFAVGCWYLVCWWRSWIGVCAHACIFVCMCVCVRRGLDDYQKTEQKKQTLCCTSVSTQQSKHLNLQISATPHFLSTYDFCTTKSPLCFDVWQMLECKTRSKKVLVVSRGIPGGKILHATRWTHFCREQWECLGALMCAS